MMEEGNGTSAPTSTPTPYSLAGSFPHYKQIVMPPDQKEKILAMHEASKANAGIYVAVVLAMYVILLTLLLCRYRRQLPQSDAYTGLSCNRPSQGQQQQQPRSQNSSPFLKLTALCDCTREQVEENSPEEVGQDIPMTAMAMTLIPRPPTALASPFVNVNITLTMADDVEGANTKPVAV